MAEVGISEIPTQQGFRDLVLETQKKWRSNKKNPLREFSQAIDIPERVSGNIINLVIENLPSFVSEKVRQELRDNHPNPIVAAGFLEDKRFSSDKADGLKSLAPSWLKNSEDEKDWADGLEVLNEIATDTLAQDVIKNLGHRNKWFAAIATISGLESRSLAAYKKGLSKTEKMFGGKDKFEKFRQNLILAMLTGDNKEINDQLEGLGYQDIDRFALEIGREAKYSDGLEWLPEKIRNSRLSLTSDGFVSVDFPGIINLNLATSSPNLISMGSALWEVQQLAAGVTNPTIGGVIFSLLVFNGFYVINSAISSQHTLVHETLHYLSQDSDRVGLEKWKK